MNITKRYLDRWAARMNRIRHNDFWYWPTIMGIKSMNLSNKEKRGIKNTVRLMGCFPGIWQRTIEQTHRGNCQCGSTLFVASGAANVYVILNRLLDKDLEFIKRIKSERNPPLILCLHMEPPEYIQLHNYESGIEYLIADVVYTTSESLIKRGGKFERCPPYVHFHCGKSIDFLETVNPPLKINKKIVLITSDISDLDGHKLRLKFVEKLDSSSLNCEIWGRGSGLTRFKKYKGYAKSKWDVYRNSEFSIVLENSVHPDYWSEKIADALLSYTYPIYYGCPNVSDYLPAQSHSSIDLNDPNVVDDVKRIVYSTDYQVVLTDIKRGRKKILENENLYSFLDRKVSSLL